jgi:hypothetical protein
MGFGAFLIIEITPDHSQLFENTTTILKPIVAARWQKHGKPETQL